VKQATHFNSICYLLVFRNQTRYSKWTKPGIQNEPNQVFKMDQTRYSKWTKPGIQNDV